MRRHSGALVLPSGHAMHAWTAMQNDESRRLQRTYSGVTRTTMCSRRAPPSNGLKPDWLGSSTGLPPKARETV